MSLNMIKTAMLADKSVLDQLLQQYLHELTQFEKIPVNEAGQYLYPYLDLFWRESGRYPYLFYHDHTEAGFALVRSEDYYYSMAEYTILTQFRHQGLGTIFATEIIHRHRGRWHIEYNMRNIAGCRFWNNLVNRLVQEDYIKVPAENGREYLEFTIR